MVFAAVTSDHKTSSSPKLWSKTLLISVAALVAQLAKRAERASKRLKPPHKHSDHRSSSESPSEPNSPFSMPRSTPRSPFTRPKKLMRNISNKVMQLVRRRKDGGALEDEDDFGDGGLWRKTILMGDKCQPLDFSGVIYYDENGNKLNQLPLRSPRATASPMPGYLARRDFT